MNYYSRAPLIRLIIPFIAGIVLAVHWPLNISRFSEAILALYIITCTFALSKYSGNFRFRQVYGLLVTILLILCGYQLTFLYNQAFDPEHFSNKIFTDTYYATITEPVQEKGKSIKAAVEIKAINTKDGIEPATGKILVYFQKSEGALELKLHDRLIFKAGVNQTPSPTNPEEFDYRKYLANHQIFHQAYIKSDLWKKISPENNFSLKSLTHGIRLNMLNIFKNSGIEEKEFAVASALILGYKNDLDPDLIKAYSGAGAMHVLAVSGLHVGIIFMVMNFFLSFLDRSKKTAIIKALIMIATLWTYAFLTGLSPSVLRASTMFSFVIAGKPFRRGASIYNALAASAFVLLAYNPYLIMEVGFQLSYLAVLGIVYFQPKIYNWFVTENWLLDKLWALTAVSLAAQLATFPIGLFYFNQFPNYFILSNLIVIPGATLVLYSGIILLFLSAFSAVFPAIETYSSYFAIGFEAVIRCLNFLVASIEQLPFSITDFVYVSNLQVWLIYFLISGLTAFFVLKKNTYLKLSLFIILAFLTVGFSAEDFNGARKMLVVYNIKGHSVFDLIEKNKSILLSDLKVEEQRDKIRFHVKNNWVKLGIKETSYLPFPFSKTIPQDIEGTLIDHGFLIFGGKTLLFLNKKTAQFPEMEKQPTIDYLIISKDFPWENIENLLQTFNIKQVIIDTSVPLYKAKNISNAFKELKKECYTVGAQGAFIQRF